MIGARRREQRRLGERTKRRGASREQEGAQLLGLWRAAGLARRHHLEAAIAQMLGEPRKLRRLADALAAFEGDEAAFFGRRLESHFLPESFW